MSLLSALRAGTREAHRGLEDELDVLGRCRSPRTYVPLLQGFRSLYGPLERSLETAPATGRVVPDFAERRKTAWLDDDLAALGARPAADCAVPTLTTAEDVAGTCYVLEGATLGGALVAREVDDTLPTRFFASYGGRRGAMWAAFRGHLSALDDRGADADRAVAAARRTFALFARACR
jgi:heme oxygenase (biliverdin-IX-beta and delta-forming)